MSNIFGGSQANSQTITKYTGLNLQTSSAGVCIPIPYGRNRAGTNAIWYNDFQAHSQGTGKGGGKGSGGKGATSYQYSAAVILSVGEGPISNIGTVWVNQTTSTLAALNLTLFTGTGTQTPPAWVVSNYPTEAVSYAFTAYLFSDNYDLGSSAALPAHNFEYIGLLSGTAVGAGVPDVNFADLIYDLLTNTRYGLGLSPTAFSSSLNDFRMYCLAQGLWASPYMNGREQVTSTLQRWAQLANAFVFWSGNGLKFVPLANSVIVGNGVTYTPNLSPRFNLILDDFIFAKAGEDPVTVTRIDPADGYNSVEVDVNDRANSYYTNPIYWRDQASATRYGILQSQIISAPEICDVAVATTMASLIGQRAVYIRNTYAFKVSSIYAMLEPGDIVTLTEPFIGLSLFPVRILTIEEDEKFNLAITAEEFPSSVGTNSPFSPSSATPSAPPDTYADPGNVNPPFILEPTPITTAGQPQLWVGLSGGSEWGGAEIWISTDSVNYGFLGTISAPIPQGVLTANLPSHSDPDTSNTLAVSMTQSGQALSTAVTHADADAFQSVALINDEIVAYGSVALTGALAYNLTYLRRGVYNTTIASHTPGAAISFINPQPLFKYILPEQYVGVPLYLKFTSFNRFGNSTQELSAVTAYNYTPTGVGYYIAPPSGATITPSNATQSDGTSVVKLTFAWAASGGPAVGTYLVQWSTDNVHWTGVSVGASSLSYALLPVTPNTNYYLRVAAISTSGLAQSTFATVGPVSSGPLVTSVPSAPVGLTVTAIPGGCTLNWTASSDHSILSYQIWIALGASQPFGSASLVQTVSAPATTATVTGLAPTAISIFLVAINAAGSSSPAG